MTENAKITNRQELERGYDCVVIGAGNGGLAAAAQLAAKGAKVLLLEQHTNFGGLATWFKRRGGHIFDVSLHGFPYGMVKSCRKYWNKKISESIVQLPAIRFDNPQFSFTSSYDQKDFTRILTEYFKLSPETVEKFFITARKMEFFDDQSLTTRELFAQFFRKALWS